MKFAIALATLVTLAVASPAAPPSSAEVLAKRDTEIVYLANCVSAVSCCRPEQDYSQIIYYPNSASSQNGAVPPDSNRCTVSSNSFTTWEGQTHPCKFSSGVTFTSRINGGSHAQYSYSGTGNNGKNWNCYRDNNRVLFNPYMPEASNSCRSIYYCTPA